MKRISQIVMTSLFVVLLVVSGIKIFSASPTLAATIDQITATCRYVSVSGETEIDTSYVKVGVYLASDLNKIIAQQTVSTHGHLRAGASYAARLDIRGAKLAEGTRIIIAVGESDGIKYLRPAALIGADCNSNGIVPATVTPGPTATLDPLLTDPTATPTPIYQTRTPVISTPTFTGTPR